MSTAAQRYTYICDASRDVAFDDGSTDLSGTPNGLQNYVANKVIKVSSVAEDTEVKATSYSLVLDGNGLGAFASTTTAATSSPSTGFWILTLPGDHELIYYGFREGDKVTVKDKAGFKGDFNIARFTGPNTVLLSKIDVNLALTSPEVTMALSSDEIISVLLDKNTTNYSSFINREVFIYRAYFQDGTMIGTPFLLFKGIISGVGFEDSEKALEVTWSLTSHWGDFSQVKGRITSDDFHRALDQNGVPQPQSALKVAYAYDKGFTHSETSINILAQYSVQVEKQDVSVKKGFLGIGSKVKVKKYYVNETQNTALDFQLQAKALPVIYGVRNTTGIPIFADTLKSDSSTVYVLQALSEGEIGGIYDVYIDGNSLICNDKADFDARSTQTADGTVQLVCRGRADRGDVLGGVSSVSSTVNQFYDNYYSNPSVPYKTTQNYDLNAAYNYNSYVEPTVTNTDRTGAGIIDGQSISLTSPQKITIDVFSGKPGQKAASSLVSIAKANNFKIQNDYWNGVDTTDYWGPNHRLLDTAYVVSKFLIEEGETTIPNLEFVVRGKTIDCYNYDKSYSHYNKVTGESADNFLLGDSVRLEKMDGTSLIDSVQIVDKWTFANSDGSLNTRFRFSVDPPLSYNNGIPRTTMFRMKKGTATWTMFTFNYQELSGTNTVEWITPITAATNSNAFVQFGFASNGLYAVGGDPIEDSSAFSVTDNNGYPINNMFFSNALVMGKVTSSTITTKYSWAVAGPSATAVIAKNLVRRNVITLPTGSNATNGYYNGFLVTLTRSDLNTGRRTVQTKKIIDYNGANRIATIDGLWDYGFHPKNGDTISLTPAYADSRVSINPAMQTMDYVCSTTYGRGLDPLKDLHFESWLNTARVCDQQSNVTVKAAGAVTGVNPGDTYRYPSTGNIIWQGTVVGTLNGYIEFSNVIGKLSNAWNSWKSYKVGELVYSENRLYTVTGAGVKTTKPVHTGEVNGLKLLTGVAITKVGGSDLALVFDGNPVRAEKDGATIPGYSLYDADGIDYWRMIGWDEFSQRYVTQHQTNLVIDTSQSLFDNVNSLLEHFGGIMRYSAGKYYLEIEEAEGPISEDDLEARNITPDHIIGKIRISDEGIRSSFNSLTASYADPANKFESRNISFFNSDYLKSDKGIPKKGNLTIPGVTNYYNTRLLADRFLNRSRFGLTVSFNMSPRGTILLAGQVIQLQYPRYSWDNKKLRIINLTHQEDATVDIVAEEYDDSFYGLSNISKQAGSGLAGNNALLTGIGAPTNLRTTNIDNGDETVSGIEITWTNSVAANTRNVSTELYSSYSNNLYVQIKSISGNTITTVQNPHNLKVGELITSLSTIAGLESKSYFIKEIKSSNQFTISESKGGTLKSLTDNSDVGTYMQTANLTATIATPANSFVDTFAGVDGRVVKYYWVRHKVIQGS
ncbi:MAG: hypothetical protein EOO61_02000 [Hymenobacter sp.]|nr:MAG: hypothetical protein EOO61_02000 [Hymenobacter sp.]